jgi:IS1 family transposase
MTGKHNHIRYLRCRSCQTEFSERKGTPLWNAKLSEDKIASIGEHLADKNSFKATSRLVKTSKNTVKRYAIKLGLHAQAFHDQHAQQLRVHTVEFDERHGYAHDKTQVVWEANAIDPVSKFVLEVQFGSRDLSLIRNLMTSTRNRLDGIEDLIVFTDGLEAYKSLFPSVFGQPQPRPPQKPSRWRGGRYPSVTYRIPRGVVHAQVMKKRVGHRVVGVETRLVHGTKKALREALVRLGYTTVNTSAVERFNGTARSMNATQVRRAQGFARTTNTRVGLGWWTVGVYNWCRANRGLRERLREAVGQRLYSVRSPAMALGLTDHVWDVLGFLRVQVFAKLGSGSS